MADKEPHDPISAYLKGTIDAQAIGASVFMIGSLSILLWVFIHG